MELKYLHTFKTILETGSFQKAAERLSYAQSTITLQMQQMEQELSFKLFEKVGRRMQLTEAGKGLVPYIDSVLSAVLQMESYGKNGKELAGTLSIAIPETNCQGLFNQNIKKVSKAIESSRHSFLGGEVYICCISFLSIRLILSLMVSVLVVLKWICTR